MKLVTKLTLLFLLLAIVPIMIVGYIAYHNGRQAIEQNTIDHLTAVNSLKQAELDRWIVFSSQSLQYIATRPYFKDEFAGAIEMHEAGDKIEHAQVHKRIIDDHLKPFLEQGGFTEIFILRPGDGLIMISTDPGQQGKYRETQPYFTEGAKGTFIQNVYYSQSLQQPAMTIGTPIRDRQENLIAVMAGRLDLKELSEIMGQGVDRNLTEDTYLVNNFNFFITEPRFGKTGYALKKTVHTQGVEAAISGETGFSFYKDYRGVPVIGAYRWLSKYDMCIITEIDQAEALAPIHRLALMIAGIMLAMVVVVVVVGFLVARTITRPIELLSNGAADIAQGNLDIKVGTSARDEIGGLSRAFDYMAKELKVTTVSRDELAESENRFRTLVENIPQKIFMKDKESTYVSCNWNFARDLKITPEEFIGKNDFDFFPAELAEKYRVDDKRIMDSGETEELEEKYIQDGEERWVNTIKTPVVDQAGNTIGILGIFWDITERKRLEQALKDSEKKYREIIETTQDIVFRQDLKGNFLFINAPSEARLGYSLGEILKLNGFKLVHTEDLPRVKQAFAPLAKGLPVQNVEYRYQTRDGSYIHLQTSASPIFDADGNITSVSGISHDVTELKRIQQELIQSQRELHIRNRIANVFLSVPDEDIYGDVLQVILEAMESKYGVFGYLDENGSLIVPTMTRDVWEQCQVPQKDFVFPRDIWGHSSWCRAIREKTSNYTNKRSKITPEGHIPIDKHISVPIIYHGEAIGLIQVANRQTDYREEDVLFLEGLGNQIGPILHTRIERDRQEQGRKKALEELQRSNAELERFAYVASHDLQEPLRMVASYTQLLEKRYKEKLDTDAKEFIDYAVDGAKRMQMLINDLLAYSRVGTRGKPFEPTNMELVFEAAIANLHIAINESKAKITHDPLPQVMADEGQLVQVFQNLLSNAIKFKGNKPPRVHISAAHIDSAWVFSVKDNGIGIDPQYFGRIFIVFQRLHREDYPGTGIGLAISNRIIQRHGGKMWIESEESKGSTFYFSIPTKDVPRDSSLVARDDKA